MNFPVVILAGGLATRLRPRTETMPKALLPVAGQPFLAHQLQLLQKHGVSRVVLCVGFLGEQIERQFGNGCAWGLELQYAYDGDELRGTGGALRQALPLLGEQFLVLYGDSYLRIDYAAVAMAFEKSGKRGLMTVFRNAGQWDKSNVWYENGRIRQYDKTGSRPEMEYIDYGLTALHRSVLEEKTEKTFDLSGVFTRLAEEGDLAVYEATERFYEIGSPEGLKELDALLSKSGGSGIF